MTRFALGLEYDGSAFAGWQAQAHARSVQQELERAMSVVADHPVAITAAGRTDAGVHALLQVVHFDSPALRSSRAWVLGANSELPEDISVRWATPVPDDFHARYSALSRTYLYRIANQPCRPALQRRRVCWVRRPLSLGLMHSAAQALIGEHDFSSFRAAECQALSAVRRVTRIDVSGLGATIAITVSANAFLHHMVRNVAGALIAVGNGRRPATWLAELLAARDRRLGAATAPPQGLYLARVDYPPTLGVPPAEAGDACPATADV